MSKTYSTGELAKLCGVTVRTVQYYDQRGILVPAELTEGGRRLYTESDVEKLKLLTYLRSLGISIDNIGKIYEEENKEKVIDTILEEQISILTAEAEEKNRQLHDVKEFKSKLHSIEISSPESMVDIAHIMAKRKEIKKVRKNLILMAIPMGLVEYGTLIYSIVSHNWLVFGIGMIFVVIMSVILSAYYMKSTSYICPECHKTFNPPKMENLFAAHTLTTRKLTCTHCGKKSFCIETVREE